MLSLPTKKTASINLMVHKETKEQLENKAKQLNITLTCFIEKIAKEQIIFLDDNVKMASKLFLKA